MTRTVVLDASAIVEFVLDPRDSGVTELVEDDGCWILVPHLCDVEVASALRGAVRRGSVDVERGEEAIDLYEVLPLARVTHVPFLRRMMGLRDNFTVYDAAYVALAEALEAVLYTADAPLARAVREHSDLEVTEV